MTKKQATGAVLAVLIGAAIGVSMIHTPSDSTTAPSATGSGSSYTPTEQAWVDKMQPDLQSISSQLGEVGTLLGQYPNLSESQAETLGADLQLLVNTSERWLNEPAPSPRFAQLSGDWTTAMTTLHSAASEAIDGLTNVDLNAMTQAANDMSQLPGQIETCTSDAQALPGGAQ